MNSFILAALFLSLILEREKVRDFNKGTIL